MCRKPLVPLPFTLHMQQSPVFIGDVTLHMQKKPVPIGFVTLAHLEHPFFTILTRAARPSEQVNTSITLFLRISRTPPLPSQQSTRQHLEHPFFAPSTFDVPSTSQFLTSTANPSGLVRDNPGLSGIIRDNPGEPGLSGIILRIVSGKMKMGGNGQSEIPFSSASVFFQRFV